MRSCPRMFKFWGNPTTPFLTKTNRYALEFAVTDVSFLWRPCKRWIYKCSYTYAELKKSGVIWNTTWMTISLNPLLSGKYLWQVCDISQCWHWRQHSQLIWTSTNPQWSHKIQRTSVNAPLRRCLASRSKMDEQFCPWQTGAAAGMTPMQFRAW